MPRCIKANALMLGKLLSATSWTIIVATRTNLYTSKNLAYNLLPLKQWEVLRKHGMRFRPRHRRAITSFGVKGYFQLRIVWGQEDKWVYIGTTKLPLSDTVLAHIILQAERTRAEILAKLGPPRPPRGSTAPKRPGADPIDTKRRVRARETRRSDAGRTQADRTLAAITARRSR